MSAEHIIFMGITIFAIISSVYGLSRLDAGPLPGNDIKNDEES